MLVGPHLESSCWLICVWIFSVLLSDWSASGCAIFSSSKCVACFYVHLKLDTKTSLPSTFLFFVSTVFMLVNSTKDKRNLKTSNRVCRIPCSSSQVYIRTTKPSINTRIEKHLLQLEKSSVAENTVTNPDHKIVFSKTEVLSCLLASGSDRNSQAYKPFQRKKKKA